MNRKRLMRRVGETELSAWVSTGRVLEADGSGLKVVALADGDFLKIFYTRRAPVLARLRPLALRFARNCAALKARGIVAPEVVECFWIDKAKGISACRYQPIPGRSLDWITRTDPDAIPPLLPALARFIRKLHRDGVYFRSLHPGNIVLEEQGEGASRILIFGLVDVLDMRCGGRSLGSWKIRRNFRHFQSFLGRHDLTFPMAELQRLYEAAKTDTP